MRFGWLGICAGAGTPQPIVDLLNRHIAAIVASPEYRALIEKGGSHRRCRRRPPSCGKVITQTCDEVAASIREFGLQQDAVAKRSATRRSTLNRRKRP